MTDILIRGMEMPKEGEKILIAADGSVWVNAWPTRGYMRMENVHAVPLPEGHGRLIDADAMLSKYVQDVHGLDGIYDTTDLPEMLSYMPSIVPSEETPHESKPELVRCEKCGFKNERKETDDEAAAESFAGRS